MQRIPNCSSFLDDHFFLPQMFTYIRKFCKTYFSEEFMRTLEEKVEHVSFHGRTLFREKLRPEAATEGVL